MQSRLALLVLVLMLTPAVGGCGGDGVGLRSPLVGGPCAGNRDCQERCVTGGNYPEGTCTVSCSTDDDCPGGTYCVDKDNGVCLLACEIPSDCRGGYTCKGEQNRGHGGDSLVCIAN